MADPTVEFASSFAGSTSRSDAGLTFRPSSRDEAARGVEAAHRLGITMHASPSERGVHLDLSRLDRILEVDERSRLIHVEVGLSLGAVESKLGTFGSSLMTAASPSISVSGYLASGCSGARVADDDPVSQTVAGLDAVTLDGRRLKIRPAPRRAVGPDLVGAVLASGWALAIPLSVHLVARPRRALHALGYQFSSKADAEHALAWMRGRGVRPAHARLRADGEGALLSIWLEAGPLLSPMQAIVTEEARSRGASATEPDPYEAEVVSPKAAPALDGFVASLRHGARSG
jgi:FAD/FMN-containing dehydrogenase